MNKTSPFVSTKETAFQLNGTLFPVSGVNSYFLAFCNEDSRRATMATAKAMGASVIRAWAFYAVEDYAPGKVAFQYFQDGNILFNEGPNGLQRLDALIKAADDLNLKLILPLTNYWIDFGGMPLYVKWLSPGSDVTEFYRAPVLRAAYQSWVNHLLTRRNTLTGRLYSEEPSIMAWELTNEARCQTDGGRELLLDWVGEMAAFVKQRDSNHLLALGDEGMFYRKCWNDLYDGTYGVDWEANLQVNGIDFGTYHFYPQTWGRGNDSDFAKRWITDHYRAAAGLNKPSLLEEFGLKLDGKQFKTPQDRNRVFGEWRKIVQDTGTAGSLLWMLGQKGFEDTVKLADDYAIFDASEVPGLSDSVAAAG